MPTSSPAPERGRRSPERPRRSGQGRGTSDGAGWYVYVLRCGDQSLYTGVARDLAGRIARHNAGMGARYTRARLPVRLVYWEPADDRSCALRREHAIRRLTRNAKEMLAALYEVRRSTPG